MRHLKKISPQRMFPRVRLWLSTSMIQRRMAVTLTCVAETRFGRHAETPLYVDHRYRKFVDAATGGDGSRDRWRHVVPDYG